MKPNARRPQRGIADAGQVLQPVLVGGPVSRLHARWGNLPPNRFADRAGRHRRLAIGSALLTVPFIVMALASVGANGQSLFSVVHLAAAASFLWLAADLTRTASLVGPSGAPHLSVLSLFAAFSLLIMGRPERFEQVLGSSLLTFGMVALAMAVAFLALDDLDGRPAQPVGSAGRLMLIVGGFSAGFAAMNAMFSSYGLQPIYSVGLGMAGTLLVGMAVFEGRLLWRGLVLIGALHSANRREK